MSIQVKFFASLRESLRQSETAVEHASTVTEVWNQATQSAALPDNLLVAINLDYANMQSQVKDGDEVAFFPPVTGG